MSSRPHYGNVKNKRGHRAEPDWPTIHREIIASTSLYWFCGMNISPPIPMATARGFASSIAVVDYSRIGRHRSADWRNPQGANLRLGALRIELHFCKGNMDTAVLPTTKIIPLVHALIDTVNTERREKQSSKKRS